MKRTFYRSSIGATLGALLLGSLSVLAPAQSKARLLRFPHVQGDTVAFCYGGDIWTVDRSGGAAHRVTSYDAGYEIFPRISPDGKWIAFSGEYSGTRQIYAVPTAGGEPRQLTHYPDVGPMPPRGGYDNLVFDWTPDGSKILVRCNRTPYGQRVGRYFLVDPEGGLEQALQIPEGGPATLSPDGTKLAYNIISREWRTWKRYTAGRAQDVWIYDLKENQIEQVTDWKGTDNWPMWLGKAIYYTSDQNGTLNLFAYDTEEKSTRAVTSYTDYDILFPSRGTDGLVFERGGNLYVMDAGTEKITQLEITLADDRPWDRPVWKEGSSAFSDFDISPSAKRAVVEFRGDLFSVPAKQGEVRNLTQSPARREMQPNWSPDGKSLSYLAEDGDDYELFVRAFSYGQERQLTRATGAWIQSTAWSPDSRWIAFTDKKNRISVTEAQTGTTRELDTASEGGVRSVSWSHDSKWLTYTKQSRNGHSSVWVCDLEGKATQVTSDEYSDGSPAFGMQGDYLFFTSARDFNYGDMNFKSRMYALLLRKEVKNPVLPIEDEEPLLADAGSEKKDKSEEDLTIDFEGISQRIVVLPGRSGRYAGLIGVKGGVLHYRDGSLELYSIDTQKSSEVLSGVRSWTLTAKRDQMLYRYGSKLCLAKVAAGQKAGSNALPLKDVRLRVQPSVEWAQMYRDAWRIMRDWFYDPKMHGVDWKSMQEKHAKLLPHISHRADLDFVIGELIGELNCGHTYVLPGETPSVTPENVGALGCDFEVANGRYRIQRILDGENWIAASRNPLREPGVDISEGDYLIAIDGRQITASDNPYAFLSGKVGKKVILTVNAKPQQYGSRKVIVRPTGSEVTLRYITWVNRNRKIVDELSGGRIGYIHAPNTAVPGHRSLAIGWAAQSQVKEAMIIDDRYNGGGFIPIKMVEMLGAPVLNYWARRDEALNTSPNYAFEGPQTMLINGYSSSGGDALPFYFRKRGLGKLMGKTTWGGLVGYSGSPRLIDGGGMAVPSFAFVNTEGQWDVEAVGVTPDIEVFDDPTLIAQGREPMLEAAVKHLLNELKSNAGRARPKAPPGPKRKSIK